MTKVRLKYNKSLKLEKNHEYKFKNIINETKFQKTLIIDYININTEKFSF